MIIHPESCSHLPPPLTLGVVVPEVVEVVVLLGLQRLLPDALLLQ